MLLEFGATPFGPNAAPTPDAPADPDSYAVAVSWIPPTTGAG